MNVGFSGWKTVLFRAQVAGLLRPEFLAALQCQAGTEKPGMFQNLVTLWLCQNNYRKWPLK